MKQNNIIVIDPGKSTFKTLMLDDKIISHNQFISKSRKVMRFPESQGDYGQFQTIYEKQKFSVGSINAGFDMSATKNNLNTYVKIISGIGYWLSKLEDSKAKFDLVVGMPTSDYTNEKIRKEFYDKIQSFKENTYQVDNVEFKPNIEKITLCSEGMGIATRVFNKERYNKKKILVIDIGGYNINLRLYDKESNILLSRSLDNVGCNQIIEKVKSELRTFINADKLNLDETDITGCIANGNFEKIRDYLNIEKEQEKELLDITITQFLEKGLFSTSSDYSIDRSTDQLLLITGGGSYMLKPYFEQMFKENNENNLTTSLNPVWENAYSYLLKGLKEGGLNKNLLQNICESFVNVKSDNLYCYS